MSTNARLAPALCVLAKEVGDDRVDMVLANPPFGKKSSITVINEKTGTKEQEKLVYKRTDFWATTSNKQLDFVQHVANMLKIGGKAAVVVPMKPCVKTCWNAPISTLYCASLPEAALEEFRSVEEVLAAANEWQIRHIPKLWGYR